MQVDPEAATPGQVRRGDEPAARADDGPRWIGIRFKSLEAATRRRGLRTLERVLVGVLDAGGVPDGFVLTLPKVTSAAQVEAMVEVCDALERAYGLRRLGFELQVETPQAVLDAAGTATVARMVGAAQGRCTGLHYGTYDYSAGLGVAPDQQRADHPAAEHAKHLMALAGAAAGVPVCDGSSAILAVGAIKDRPVVRDGEIVPAHMLGVTLACDHRILYGAPAAGFLARIRTLLEEPLSLAL